LTGGEEIKDHWNGQARFKDSYKSSWADLYMIEKEIAEINKHIGDHDEVLDIGCNNGYSDFELARIRPGITIHGFDYSEEMIRIARERLGGSGFGGRLHFSVGDIRKPGEYPRGNFDVVLLKRVLINLKTEEEQVGALENIRTFVRDGGKIILSEAFEENWERLNRLRREFGLDDLKQPWHNRYLSGKILEHLYSRFSVLVDDDYSSSYYVVSRVLHPWMKKMNHDDSLEYLSEINRLGSLVPNFGDYGIQRLLVLKPKGP
jgi:SAM-dependent methyltransferase